MLNLLQKNPIVSREPETAQNLSDYYVALFQHLRSHFGGFEGVGRTIGITSTACGEGVSTVSTNLAVTAAQQLARPVLLIDADPRLGKSVMNPSNRPMPGLFDILLGRAQPSDCVRATEFGNVYVLSTGVFTTRGAVRYPKDPFKQLIGTLKNDYGLVVVNLPIANELTDCFSICGLVDGLLLVVEAERVPAQAVRHAKDLLLQADANVLGVVFNKRRNHVPDWLYRRL